ncbi:MAG: BlaI/MecI/CopY family transcriptional regulator [Lachnotalea sp.]
MSSMYNDIIKNLSTREVDVLEVFWVANKPLISSEISKYNPSLTKGTIQSIIKSLTQKKLIKVDEIVYSGTVLARSYIPLINANEYAQIKICNDVKNFSKHISKTNVIAALIESDEQKAELFDELEKMIYDARVKLKKEKK